MNEIIKYIVMNANENYGMQKKQFSEIYSCKHLHENKISQINNLSVHLKELEQEEQSSPKANRKKKPNKC